MTLPDLDELVALRAAAHGLKLRSRGPARSLLAGRHHGAHHGRGLEFEEVRLYVAGDDPRSIDWRVTARRGRPHTKLFREERERPVWVLADLHSGLFFGTRRQLKSAVVVRAAALLAWIAALGGDRVGAVIAGAAASRILPPRSRDAGVLPLLGALIEMQPRAPGPPGPQRLNEALRTLVPLARPGCLVLALSDFGGLDAVSETLWSALAAHSEGHLFWITDPLEEQGLPNGRFRAGVPDRVQILDGATTRPRWREAWREREEGVSKLSQRFDMPVTRLDTHEPVEHVLQPLLQGSKSAA